MRSRRRRRKQKGETVFNVVDLIVCVLGLLIYLYSKEGKLETVGKIMFGVGLLAFLFAAAAMFSIRG